MTSLKETAGMLVDVARDAGADDCVVEVMDSTVDQIRFSNAQIDISNSWSQLHAHVFVSVGGRTISSDLRDLSRGRSAVRQMVGRRSRCRTHRGPTLSVLRRSAFRRRGRSKSQSVRRG